MLDKDDLLDVINMSQVALKCDHVDELRKEVLNLLPKLFRVERGAFFLARQYPSPRIDHDNAASQGIDQRYMSLFRTHYHKVDPFLKTMNSGEVVVTTNDVLPLKEFMDTEYYGDFLEPQSICYEMAIYLRSRRRLLGTLAVMRSRHDNDFSLNEKSKAELLASQIAGALDKLALAEKVSKAYQTINCICSDLPYKGIMVLDDSLEPIYMDEEARRTVSVLSKEKAFCDQPLSLPEELHAPCQQLMEDSAQKGDRSDDGVVRILNRKTGVTEATNLRMIKHSGDSGLFLLRLDQGNPEDPLSEHLGKLGITRSEAEIINLVCKGFKNSEIAAKQFICEGTVENHLHSIYEKLEVRNRASLVNFVAGLRHSR
jgi:DNA-binding CsgD family transcriptional regulator